MKKLVTLILLLCNILITLADERPIVRVLAMGNSFTIDAMESSLYALARDAGIHLVLGNACWGGFSIEDHYQALVTDSACYEYRKCDNGDFTISWGQSTRLSTILADEPWEYVVLQQTSYLAGFYDTYEPSMTNLIGALKDCLPNKDAKYGFYMVWTYNQDSKNPKFVYYNNDQMFMYESIVDATKRAMEAHPELDFLIPTGTAIQNLRTSFVGDNLNRDGAHLTVDLGRATAAFSWYAALFGEEATLQNTYTPYNLNEFSTMMAKNAALDAMHNPYTITPQDYPDYTGENTIIPSDINLNFSLWGTQTNGWNDVSLHDEFAGGYKDIKGKDSGIILRSNDHFWGANTAGAPMTYTTLDMPSDVSQTALVGYSEGKLDDGEKQPTATLQFQHLNKALTYDFTFFASRENAQDNRETQFTLAGKDTLSATLDASNNTDGIVTIFDMCPDDEGSITLTIQAGPNNNNANKFYYLNALRISPHSTYIIEDWDETDYSDFEITHEFFTPNGIAKSSSGGYDMTGYIPVKGGDIIVFSGDRSPGIPFIIGYSDKEGNGASVLLGNFDPNDYSHLNVTEEEITIPAGIAYVRCSARNTSVPGWASRNMSVIKRSHIDIPDDTFQYIINKHGYNPATVNDLTEEPKIKMEEPTCAYVNITDINEMPTKKTENMHAWLECYDGNGNYFKKRVVLNAQGQSTIFWEKRNISVDFCEDEWQGEKETDITIGQWVKQSSFHLKANYTSYFRGECQIGYMIYDDIIADRRQPFPWQRAGIADVNERAVGHPLGFPCYVYLNGRFYGLYAWQLKKHRKNMNQEKGLAEHIHLDGKLSNQNFWNGKINWEKFEIRNPKTLYCPGSNQEGGTYIEYDKNAPNELIDDTMPCYDAENDDHVLTNLVKKYVIQLSQYKTELREMIEAGAKKAAVRKRFEECFDVQSMLDYTVMSYVTSNGDGFERNWQWITYDGEKWYIMPYDLDCIFGNMWQGTFFFPPEVFWYFARYDHMHNTGPMLFFLNYYKEDIADRYKDLRYSGQISCEPFIKHFSSWYERVGKEGYDLEYVRWPNSPCNGESLISPNWTASDSDWLTFTWDDYNSLGEFDKTRSYKAGDKCTLGDRIWTATTQTQGIKPYTRLAHTDSLERLKNYINRKLELLDDFFGYDRESYENGLINLSEESGSFPACARKYLKDGHLYIIKDNETYSVDGKRMR